MTRLILVLALLGALLDPPSAAQAQLRIARLTCENRTEPVGIDAATPRLGWILESDSPGEGQRGYRVLVATTPSLLGEGRADLWDSGYVESAQSVGVPYGGRPLRSGQRACWTLRVYGRSSADSTASATSWWEMGITRADDWHAAWISHDAPLPARDEDFYDEDPAPLLRREFTLSKKVRRARAYVSGLGYYELRLNGDRVGDHLLDPGWTDYADRVLYSTYDVTDMLREGRNAVGVMLGNGWYNPLPIWGWGNPERNLRKHLTVGRPRVLVQIEIEHDDGERSRIVSDTTWRTAPGPIVRNSVFLGEQYDATREQHGWDAPGFDDGAWRPAAVPAEPVGALAAPEAPPIRVVERLPPVRISEPKPGTFIVDMGRNFAGVAQLRVRGPRGARVTMRSGELLFPDGTLNGRTAAAMQVKAGGASGGPGCPVDGWQTDVYVLRGGAPGTRDGSEEIYTPRFTFHGFRFVELTGFPGTPTLDTIEGLVMSSDVRRVGEFECSDELLNRIHQMCVRTFRSNLFSVQSDCPHREKFGYGGDLVATSEAFMMNFDMSGFYRKAVLDLAEAARPNGGFTETAPFVGIADEGLGGGAGPVEWGTAHPLLCAQLWQYYADDTMAVRERARVDDWMKLIESHSRDGLLDNGIGDHETVAPRSRRVTGTAFALTCSRLAARVCQLAGDEAAARVYLDRAESIRSAMCSGLFSAETGRVDQGVQCNQAAFLALHVLRGDDRRPALEVLVREIEEKGHLTTGIFGTRWLLLALSDAGRTDLAYRIVQARDFPGWGHMLESGATTLWETWAFSDNVYSHNHPMFGSVDEWLYKVVAGIRVADDAAGADRFVIKPGIGGGLTWARGAYDSARGRVACEWRIDNEDLLVTVTIPVGSSAALHLPSAGEVRAGEEEGERTILTFESAPDGSRVFRIGSGAHAFRVKGFQKS